MQGKGWTVVWQTKRIIKIVNRGKGKINIEIFTATAHTQHAHTVRHLWLLQLLKTTTERLCMCMTMTT